MAKPSPNYSGDTLLVSIGLTIRKLRTHKGISQETLALLTELDRSYVGGIERGEHNLGLISLRRICDALEVRISELFINSGY